jgi:RNA polymerase sigma-70 factor (ECF subfamily)
MSAEEDDLARKARAGDVAAVVELADRARRLAFAYSYHCLRNPGRAEEVASDVVERVLKNLARFEPRGKGFSSWVKSITLNEVRVRARRTRRRPALVGLDLAECVPARSDPAREALGRMLPGIIGPLLARLTRDQAEAVWLCWIRGLSHCAAARVMHTNEHTVRRRLADARELLRVELAASVESDELRHYCWQTPDGP